METIGNFVPAALKHKKRGTSAAGYLERQRLGERAAVLARLQSAELILNALREIKARNESEHEKRIANLEHFIASSQERTVRLQKRIAGYPGNRGADRRQLKTLQAQFERMPRKIARARAEIALLKNSRMAMAVCIEAREDECDDLRRELKTLSP